MSPEVAASAALKDPKLNEPMDDAAAEDVVATFESDDDAVDELDAVVPRLMFGVVILDAVVVFVVVPSEMLGFVIVGILGNHGIAL